MATVQHVAEFQRPAPAPPVQFVRGAVRDLSPAYFAMVMATGGVALAAQMQGMPRLAVTLLWLNVAAYLLIWLLKLHRLCWFVRAKGRDLIDHQRGSGFFTSVAATSLLGSQFALISLHYHAAEALWVLGIVLWLLLTYSIVTTFRVKEHKPSLYEGITGAWLLAVVAPQAVAARSALVALHWDQLYQLIVNFFARCMWLWGGMLYIWMIALIFYRYMFFPFSPGDLPPPYWINKGAMATSTLAGARLIINAHDAPFLHSVLPFLMGFTVFYWVTGTWWIAMLGILAIWRHLYKRIPLRYAPLYRGAVFPLGMYSVSTFALAKAMELDFLFWVPRCFALIAFTAWLATFSGFCRTISAGLPRVRLRRGGA